MLKETRGKMGRMATHMVNVTAALAFMTAGTAWAEYEFVAGFGSFGTAKGQFNEPRGVTYEDGGRIVVADAANARIQICTDTGTCSEFGTPGVLTGEFDKPRELDFDSFNDEIVIADRGNDRIQFCKTWGSCDSMGGSGTGPAQFESPRGVAVYSTTQVVIADTENNRIQICDRQENCSVFGRLGGSPGQFDGPAGIAVNSSNQIIVADRLNNRIQVCNSTGSCTAFGSTGSGLGQFNAPTGLTVDSQDRIIVADQGNHRIQVCNNQGVCTAFGVFGSADGQLDSPWGVAVDNADRIIVSDSGNTRIQVFAETGTPVPVSIDSFTSSSGSVEAGQQVTLSWTVSNATSCTAFGGTGGWAGSTIDPAGGSAGIVIGTAGSYTFTLQCEGGGATDTKNVVVTASDPASVAINAGFNDAWFDPNTNGQGFLISVLPDAGIVFLAWFTYDTELPPQDAVANLGDPGHRWLTAQGVYAGNQSVMDIVLTSGGIFDESTTVSRTDPPGSDGTLILTFDDCYTGTIEYNIPSINRQGTIPIQRLTNDNAAVCEALSDETLVPPPVDPLNPVPFDLDNLMNAGLNDAWFNIATEGQGILVSVLPVSGIVFLAWFTYDTELPPQDAVANLGDPGHRWLTAQGVFAGGDSVLDLVITSGGLFDEPSVVDRTDPPGSDGSIVLSFENCYSGTVTYDITSINRQGVFPIQRIVTDNVPLCEALMTP